MNLCLDSDEASITAIALKHYSEWLLDFKPRDETETSAAIHQQRQCWALRERIQTVFNTIPSSAEA